MTRSRTLWRTRCSGCGHWNARLHHPGCGVSLSVDLYPSLDPWGAEASRAYRPPMGDAARTGQNAARTKRWDELQGAACICAETSVGVTSLRRRRQSSAESMARPLRPMSPNRPARSNRQASPDLLGWSHAPPAGMPLLTQLLIARSSFRRRLWRRRGFGR